MNDELDEATNPAPHGAWLGIALIASVGFWGGIAWAVWG